MARRAKGEGGLYQAKDKSWIYQYRVDGQRKSNASSGSRTPSPT